MRIGNLGRRAATWRGRHGGAGGRRPSWLVAGRAGSAGTVLAVIAALMLVAIPPAGAISGSSATTDWTQVGVPARFSASMAFDATTGQVVLFGGSNGSVNLSDTWVFDSSAWARLT